jgi:hypothetical protein
MPAQLLRAHAPGLAVGLPQGAGQLAHNTLHTSGRAQVLSRSGLSLEALLAEGHNPQRLAGWGERQVHELVAHFVAARFPILLALNKARWVLAPRVASSSWVSRQWYVRGRRRCSCRACARSVWSYLQARMQVATTACLGCWLVCQVWSSPPHVPCQLWPCVRACQRACAS